MRRTLFIRLTQPGPDALATALLRQPSGAFGRAEQAPLSRLLAEITADDRIVLLLPAEDAVVASVNLPVRQRSRLLQALPFALEEQLADDVDDMHFALGAKASDGSHRVAAMRRDRLAAYLAPLETCLAPVEGAYLDAQLLPQDAESSAALWLEPGRVLLQTAEQAVATDDSLMDIVVGRLHDLPDLRLWLADGVNAPETLPAQAERESVRSGLEQLALWTAQPAGRALNLLQGEFRPQSDQSEWWRPWRPAAAVAAALLLLSTGYQGIDLTQKRRSLEALESQNIQTFQQLFPAEQRIVDVRSQFEQQLRLLENPEGGQGFLFLLDETRQAFANNDGFSMNELQYRDGHLFIGLEGKDLQALERLREQFSQQAAVELEVLSANAGSDGVKVRLRLSPRGGA